MAQLTLERDSMGGYNLITWVLKSSARSMAVAAEE